MNVAEWVRTGDSASRLVLRCLGRFRLEDQSGSQLHIRTRKARALLAALALTGRPMSRNVLADLLWSDRGEAQARASLRQTIFELQHFGDDDRPILSVGRDELEVRRDGLVTDIELIRSAANDGDWNLLVYTARGGGPGLLTDLDGLDPEFDDWLRKERAQEPERSLSAAIAAVDRCRAEAGPRAALELVTSLLRFDPANEEVTRLALQLDHELGDRAGLHRHFQALKDRLEKDFGAAPSAKTLKLFAELSNDDPGVNRPAAETVAEFRSPAREGIVPGGARAFIPGGHGPRHRLRCAGRTSWSNRPQASADRPVIVAVMPFEQKPASG